MLLEPIVIPLLPGCIDAIKLQLHRRSVDEDVHEHACPQFSRMQLDASYA